MLQDLHQTLGQSGAAALNQAKAIYGLGGIGKTQTAVAYAYRYFYNEPAYDWVFWIRADTELNLKTDLGNLTDALALPEQEAQNLDEKVQAVQRWLARSGGWLLIFDNADQPSLLKPFRPRNLHGRVLVTSRAQVFDEIEIAHRLEIPEMSATEANDFLFRRTERQPQDTHEVAAAKQLANELGYLPLALEQAGAFIYARNLRFADYLTSYRQRRLALLQRQLPKTGDYPESVATTWSLNFQAIEQTSPAAAELLRFSAFLASDKIPHELLVQGAPHLGNSLSAALADAATDPLAISDLLEPLTRYSLIRLERDIGCYSIHRMVQEVLRDGMAVNARQQWIERAVAALNAAFPSVEFSSWTDCARLTPHVQTLLEHHHPLDSLDLATLLNETGDYLYEQGQYARLESLWIRSLAIREQQLEANHYDVAISLHNLAELYRAQGHYSAAEPLCNRSLAIREQKLGADHPDIAISLDYLGALYQSQRRYIEAEAICNRSLAIREQKLAANHLDVATSLNNLAELYRVQERYVEAEPFYKRSLTILEQQLEVNHPRIASCLNNLALLYQAQGHYANAEAFFKRSLAIREQQFGDEHPDVAISRNNVALLYYLQDRYSEAESLYEQSLKILVSKLGITHPNTNQVRENLIVLYDDLATQFKLQGYYDNVVEYLEKAIALRQLGE